MILSFLELAYVLSMWFLKILNYLSKVNYNLKWKCQTSFCDLELVPLSPWILGI